MSPVIRISDALYEKLGRLAVGFDTPAQVIDRLVAAHLGETPSADAADNTPSRAPKKITPEMIETAYRLASDVYGGLRSLTEAQEALARHTGMDAGSALGYLNNFQKMMQGECYRRTMNGAATEYYLERIAADFGQAKLRDALTAVRQHIDYYESLDNGKLQNIRKICDSFAKAG